MEEYELTINQIQRAIRIGLLRTKDVDNAYYSELICREDLETHLKEIEALEREEYQTKKIDLEAQEALRKMLK